MLTHRDQSSAIRRLEPRDDAALLQLLPGEQGYGLFIGSNALMYGLVSSDVRFWGQFRGVGAPGNPPQLEAVLMLVGHNANLFVCDGVDCRPLIAVALGERLHFIMGAAPTMAVVAQQAGERIIRVEAHHFAELPQDVRMPPTTLPMGAEVRRGAPADVDALARLYFGVTGFEGMSYHQVRTSMMHRVTQLRTYLAVLDGAVVAAASTSAEMARAAMLGGVWTAPHARGRGLSTAVVAALCAELQGEQRRPYLFYLIDNAPAARVYAKLGWHIIGGWSVLFCDPTISPY